MRKFDELKTWQKTATAKTKKKSIDYEQYFGEMDLPEEEKKKRIELAKKIEIVFLYYFTIFGDEEQADYKNMIYEKIIEIANEYTAQKQTSAAIAEYARGLAEEVTRATERNIEDEYYISSDRARFIAENEANYIANYNLQVQAVKSGKTRKRWITKSDNKVRHTHVEVNNTEVGIFEPFNVGVSRLMFPKDKSLNADDGEIVNCRCVVHYS